MAAPGSEAPGAELQPYFLENIATNTNSLYYIRSTTASIAGAIAGVLGLTNLSGLAFYLASSLYVGLIVCALNCGTSPGKYFRSASWEPMTQGLGDNALGFVLWWTLLYGVVHIYE